MTTNITEGCMICDDDNARTAYRIESEANARPSTYVLIFGPLYNGICASCWRNSVRDGVHDADVLIGLGVPREETA